MSLNIDILICTYNDGIVRCKNVIMPYHPLITYKISHQISDDKSHAIPKEIISRKDITVSQISSSGLSNNRNNCLAMADGDICIIADDDVIYELDDLLGLLRIFENDNVDVVAGKIRTYDGQDEYKKYCSSRRKISLLRIGSVSSIEIAFRRNSIIRNHIRFNPDFGLGGRLFPKGEEALFLNECIRNNLKLYYYPITIVKHPKESSGNNFIYNKNEAIYLGCLNKILFGPLAIVNAFVFMIKHFNRYKANLSPLSFLRNYYKGTKIVSKRYHTEYD